MNPQPSNSLKQRHRSRSSHPKPENAESNENSEVTNVGPYSSSRQENLPSASFRDLKQEQDKNRHHEWLVVSKRPQSKGGISLNRQMAAEYRDRVRDIAEIMAIVVLGLAALCGIVMALASIH